MSRAGKIRPHKECVSRLVRVQTDPGEKECGSSKDQCDLEILGDPMIQLNFLLLPQSSINEFPANSS